MNIIACSTSSLSHAAISVIRISGNFDLESFAPFFSVRMEKFEDKKAVITYIKDKDSVVDQVVALFFKAPNSYTGENVLELSVHGNPLNVERIIKLFTDSSLCRKACAGEFTLRAYQNKKLNLAQVEGLDLILNAKTSLALNQGTETLFGSLYKEYIDLRAEFLKVQSYLEIMIDFSEDIGEKESEILFKKQFETFFSKVSSLYVRTQGDFSSLMSPSIVLLGAVNAGKSSLFNKILQNSRSIVSSTPGTTRDYVSEYICFGGSNFKIIDTAGIRDLDFEEKDEIGIESEGIRRGIKLFQNAFFKILVINPFSKQALSSVRRFEDCSDLIYFTHADLDGFENKCDEVLKDIKNDKKILKGPKKQGFKSGPIEPGTTDKGGPIEPNLKKTGPIEPVKGDQSGPIEPDFIENFSMQDLAVIELKEIVLKKFEEFAVKNPILVERQRESIEQIYKESLKFQKVIDKNNDIGVISSELRIIRLKIEELLGIITNDEVLGNIFNNFCIGK